MVSYQTPMRKCFVSRDLKRQRCLGDELCVIPCRLLFCYYVWTQFCMCRTKVKPHFRGKYVGRFLIHSTEEAAMVKWLRKFFLATRRAKKAARKMEEKEYELIRLLSVELLWVHCLQWKKNIWSLVKGGGGTWRWIAYACLSAFQQLFVTFFVGITSLSLFHFEKAVKFQIGKVACYPLSLLWCAKQSYRTVMWRNVLT